MTKTSSTRIQNNIHVVFNSTPKANYPSLCTFVQVLTNRIAACTYKSQINNAFYNVFDEFCVRPDIIFYFLQHIIMYNNNIRYTRAKCTIIIYVGPVCYISSTYPSYMYNIIIHDDVTVLNIKFVMDGGRHTRRRHNRHREK